MIESITLHLDRIRELANLLLQLDARHRTSQLITNKLAELARSAMKHRLVE